MVAVIVDGGCSVLKERLQERFCDLSVLGLGFFCISAETCCLDSISCCAGARKWANVEFSSSLAFFFEGVSVVAERRESRLEDRSRSKYGCSILRSHFHDEIDGRDPFANRLELLQGLVVVGNA